MLNPSSNNSPIDSLDALRESIKNLASQAKERGQQLDLEATGFEPWKMVIKVAQARRSLPAEMPILTVLFGPTGVGKSTVFNQIVGAKVSVPGAIRPCTSKPLAYGKAADLDLLKTDPFLAPLDLQMDYHSATEILPRLQGQVIIDTPDFDSIELENKTRAEALLLRADRIIVVLTPEKYVDASAWDFLDYLQPLGSIDLCIFNKAEGQVPFEDCSRLLTERDLPAPLLLPRTANSDDPQQLAECIQQTLDQQLQLSGSAIELRAERLESVINYESSLREQKLGCWLHDLRSAATTLEQELTAQEEHLDSEIQNKLALELDTPLKRELEERFLKEIERIDILREPRRWLAIPFQWVKIKISGESKNENSGRESTAEFLARLYSDRYQEFVLQLCDQLRIHAQQAQQATDPTFPWIQTSNTDPEQNKELLLNVFKKLEQEIAAESDKIAEGLPASAKASFYGSQIAFHLTVGVLAVKSGGLLTITEIFAQSLISPFIAQISKKFVSSGEAKVVEQRLNSVFTQLMLENTLPILQPLQKQASSILLAIPDKGQLQAIADKWATELRAESSQ